MSYFDDNEDRITGLDTHRTASSRERIVYRWGAGFQDTETWTMKHGGTIALAEMTPQHRGNVVRMLERKAQKLPGVDIRSLHKTPLVKKMLELGIE